MRRLVIWIAAILIAYILIFGTVFLFMPMTASAAGPLDIPCVRRLDRTTDLTYVQRKRRCRVRGSGSVSSSVQAAQTHKTVEWGISDVMLSARAIFEIDKRPSPYFWSPRKWYVTDARCWVDRSIIFSLEVTHCAGRRAGDRLHMDLTVEAGFLAFKWPVDIGLTRSFHSWRTVRDEDDFVGPIHIEQ